MSELHQYSSRSDAALAICHSSFAPSSPAAWGASPARYVYILSAGGSGSTAFELLLERHSKIAAMGELALLSLQLARGGPYRCSCGEAVADCSVWSRVLEAVRECYGVDPARTPFRFRVSDVGREECDGWRAPSHWLLHNWYRMGRYAAYRRVPLLAGIGRAVSSFGDAWVRNRLFVAETFAGLLGAATVVDSSKDYIGFRDVLAAAPGVRGLFLTRDVRGVVSTYLRKNPHAGVEVAARHWMKVNGRILDMLEDAPADAWMQVRYEDLCRNLSDECRRLCAFLGLEFEPALTFETPRRTHTVGGSMVRYRGLGRLEERIGWRERLTEAQLDTIARLTGRLARRMGYDLTA